MIFSYFYLSYSSYYLLLVTVGVIVLMQYHQAQGCSNYVNMYVPVCAHLHNGI